MIFGTSDLLEPDTTLETETSKYIQGAWAAFARDPLSGLEWPVYEPEQETLVKLGFKNNTDAVLGKGDEFDVLC